MNKQPVEASFEQTCVNTIRFLAVDGVQKANSGHPGMPMGMAPVAHVLFTRHLKFDPAAPAWRDRDRFVLSAGHGSMLLYSLLHLSGYDLSLDDLKAFRQWGSRTPGHPEYGETPGVETTTGPLGQGVGERGRHGGRRVFPGGDLRRCRGRARRSLYLRHRRRRRPHGGRRIRGLLVGGPPRTGQAHRPLRRQPHHHRRRDRPRVQRRRGRALRRLRLAHAARRRRQRPRRRRRGHRGRTGRRRQAVADRRPLAHRLRRPNRQDTSKAHGEPLGADEVRLAKEALGWPLEPDVPRSRRGARVLTAGRSSAAPRRAWHGSSARPRGAPLRPTTPRPGTVPGGESRHPGGTRRCPATTPPPAGSRRAPPRERSSTPWHRSCRR